MSELNPFAKTIQSLKDVLESDETTRGVFEINVSNNNKKMIWIGDTKNVIGKLACHYEISISREPGKFTTEIHFEDSKNPKIYENTSALRENLPKELKLFKGTLQRDHIRYGEGISKDNPNLVAELKHQLVFMEKNLGDRLREIIKKFSSQPLKRYWRIGTGDGPDNYWNYMKDNKIVCVGWPTIGDLANLEINSKNDVKILMEIDPILNKWPKSTIGYQSKQLYQFFVEVKNGDVVLAQNGAKVLGVGIIIGEYSYNSSLGYPHFKDVEWKLNEPNLKNKIGLHSTVYEITDHELINKIDTLLNMTEMTQEIKTGFPLNQILFGPPGTGKTYNTINKALEIAGENLEGKTREEIKKLFDEKVDEGQILFTTFHQSMSYEDFIEGIKPVAPKDKSGSIYYEVLAGIFKKIVQNSTKTKFRSIIIDNERGELTEELFENLYYQFAESLVSAQEEESNCVLQTQEGNEFGLFKNSSGSISIKAGTKRAKMSASLNELKQVFFKNKPPLFKSYEKQIIDKILEDKQYKEFISDEKKKNYILIIDEINRGNVSQIFGELITLIEEDKRQGKSEALEVVLPYSKEKFSVPSNLYIIGTMNTADRSVEAIDTALRRRFSFEEISPRYDLEELKYEYAGFRGYEILRTLNTRIEKLLDKDHQIGHSYFMLKNDEKAEEKLTTSFYKNIIPLLQEYFYGDFGKIGLVLGNGFVRKKEWHRKSDSFADFDYLSASDFDEREVFEIVDYRKTNPDNFIPINNKKVEMNFEKAIKLLMNQNIE